MWCVQYGDYFISFFLTDAITALSLWRHGSDHLDNAAIAASNNAVSYTMAFTFKYLDTITI